MGIDSDGFGTIYKYADGSLAQGNLLIFRPGVEPNGNIYDDFDLLYAARQSISGRVTILFDDSEDFPQIPDGEYDLSDTVLRGRSAPWSDNGRVEIATSAGTVFLGLDEFINLDVFLTNVDPLLTVSDEQAFLKLTNSRIYDEQGGGLVELIAGELWVNLTDNSSLIDDDGWLFILDSSSFLGINAWNNSEIGSQIATGDGCFILQADASCNVNASQSQAMADFFVDRAERIYLSNYDNSKWQGGSVASINEAILRIASLIYTLNSNTPIPE